MDKHLADRPFRLPRGDREAWGMLAWTAALLTFFLLLILAAPFRFSAVVGKTGRAYYRVNVSWLFGGVSLIAEPAGRTIRVGLLTIRKFPPEKPEVPPTGGKAARPAGPGKKTGLKKLLKAKDHFSRDLFFVALKWAGRLWSSMSLKLGGEATFGFADPSLTGMLYGLCAALGLSGKPGLVLAPNFEEAGFSGHLALRGRLSAGRLLSIAAGLLLSRPVRRLCWSLLRRREVI